MINPGRRDFLRGSVTAAAGSAVMAWTGGRLRAATGPHLEFPPQPRERMAVASWPFRMFIDAPTNKSARDPKLPGMDLKDFGSMVVKRFGLHNIEPLDAHFSSTEPAYLAELRERTEKAGAHIVDVPVDLPDSFYDPDPARRAKSVTASRKWIDIAKTLGCPSVRLHIAGSHDAKPDVGRTAESLRQVAQYAAEKNVVANLENDDNFTEDPFFIVAVLEKVDNPYLRALPDFCNSMMTHDQDFNDRAMAAMFKHAYCISHMKDSEVGEDGKARTVDFARCFAIAKAAGYRGYFSMEWEGQGEPYAGTQRLIDETLKHLV
ncbi:MAG TPA: sugar phosphate isomerase/epimerase family protein [Thermoanaerobaculia bacterium]|nr:sugar phosphate isomerase/epimerase family protein [Thermoanaerobaculia bacterium]